MNKLELFKKKIPLYRKEPWTFAREVFKFEPDTWQLQVLADLVDHTHVSVRSGQGVGKTGLEAVVTLWFLTCFPYPKVIATAPTRQQLHDVLWAEISKWQSKSPLLKKLLKWTKTKIYMRKYEERWFATARTATKPENMQGFHEDYMLFIIDEASGVADDIMEAILGTLSGQHNKLLMCGNPTRTSGTFYDSHNKDRHHYRSHKVSSMDSSRTSKKNIDMLLEKYGHDSDVARVRVYGEFPRAEADTFIPLEIAELAKDTTIPVDKSITIGDLGVDVARFGDDETIIVPRIGDKALVIKAYRKLDTTATTGHVIAQGKAMMKDNPHLKKIYIKVDDSGVGGGVTDQLKEKIREQKLPFKVYPVVNNGIADDKEHYENVGTEQWGVLRDMLNDNLSAHLQGKPSVVDLPDDDKLISQLTTRKYRMTSKGKIALERKEDMKKRGLQSPDRADAVVLAFYRPKDKVSILK
ncbi:DEAD/DEAH box helicase family protein [Terribacillus saccharophilus]|uniref:Terminase B n=1 Tax=Terribacillus saccharophilus TaxID=361277 RepID=A0ABX4H0V2_9BACI|nr:DEAD/DEAH box helicase family protein [Terribacillus saccharophilus]PAD36334.1 terminase B [Terribacillus saccharophilus]PAD95024.1 terminase B [Terribacillus saccharophilus]PAE00753.1 terminase B [Terribacillus saccharophilus]